MWHEFVKVHEGVHALSFVSNSFADDVGCVFVTFNRQLQKNVWNSVLFDCVLFLGLK